MVIVAQGADTILLASNQPLMPNQRAIQSLQQVVDASPEILADLRKWFATTDLRIILMRHYKGDEASLVRSVDQEKLRHINTDLNLRLEFDAPRHLFEKLDPSETAQVKIQSLGSDGWRNQLGAALGIQPNSAEYQILLAEQESAAKHYDKALAHYQDALAINPRLAEAYRGAAAIHVHLKKHESAVAVLKDLLKFHPGDIEASRALAAQLFTLKRGDEAADVLRTILDQAPNDLDAIDKLASYLITVNRPTEALPYLERLAVQQPTNANVHGNLASAYLAAKRFDLAVAHFRKALDLKPLRKPSGTDETKQDLSNVVWANNLAWLLATCADSRLRNGKEAVQLATAACEAVGYKVEFVDTLAAAHAEAGQFDEAVKFGQQFLDQAELTKPELVKAGKERLELYRAHQPFRES
jgi:tetratricopeptide (TPR) repeat protein